MRVVNRPALSRYFLSSQYVQVEMNRPAFPRHFIFSQYVQGEMCNVQESIH